MDYLMIWNHHIEHVQITVAETVGVEGGGASTKGQGQFRYVTEPYFQLLAMVAMEPRLI